MLATKLLTVNFNMNSVPAGWVIPIRIPKFACLLLLFFMLSQSWLAFAHAQELIPYGERITKYYALMISGTIYNEKFAGVRGILSLSLPTSGSSNPYTVIVKGFPKVNSQNTFFWNSDDTEMDCCSDELTCRIKNLYLKRPDVHFYHLSPVLVGEPSAVNGGGRLQRSPQSSNSDDPNNKKANKEALPTVVYSQAGKLIVRVSANRVSGSVVMKGYDSIEHAYVQYTARFSGFETKKVAPTYQTENRGIYLPGGRYE